MSSRQFTGRTGSLAQASARLWRDRQGATSIEYALIGAGISIVIAAVVGSVGTQVAAFFATVPGWFGG